MEGVPFHEGQRSLKTQQHARRPQPRPIVCPGSTPSLEAIRPSSGGTKIDPSRIPAFLVYEGSPAACG
jgi:hypothetical protein